MKRFALTAIAALTLIGGGGLTAANAVEFDVGPGGVHVGPNYHHDHYYRDYGDRDYGGCRTIIRHHTNRYGEDVTVRNRVCD